MTTAQKKGFLRFFILFLPALLVTVYCFFKLMSGEIVYAGEIGEPAIMESGLSQTYGLTAVPDERTQITLSDEVILTLGGETAVSNQSRPVALSKRFDVQEVSN